MNIMEIGNHLRQRLCALPGAGVVLEGVDAQRYLIYAYVDIGDVRVKCEASLSKLAMRHANCEKAVLDQAAHKILSNLIHAYWRYQDEQG